MQAGLDKVLFVPNHVSPFKVNRTITPGHLRKQMVELAIASNPAFVLDSGEELQQVLNANAKALIGKAVIDKFGTDLPFIPKVRLLIASSTCSTFDSE